MSDHEGLLQAVWIFIFILKSVEETWKYFKEEVTFFKISDLEFFIIITSLESRLEGG